MDNYSIAGLMKKQDRSFTEELTYEEKQVAFRKFKKLYAEQMAKLSMQISRKQRIQDNLIQINEQQVIKAKQIDEQIKKKMEKHSENKNKLDNSLHKQVKMLEENWKRKMDQINQKKRQKDKEAFRKAQKMRKDAEQYFSKKKSMTARQTIVQPAQKTPEKIQKNYLNIPNSQKYNINQQIANKNFNYTKTDQKKITFLLPNLKNTKIKLNKKDFQEISNSKNDLKKEQDIKLHLQRNQKVNKQRQQANFQRMLQKLEKIEATRKIANQKLQKQVEQAKKMRQLRESPEVHAANRQKSIESLHSKSKKKLKQKKNQEAQSLKLSASKSRISDSLQKHLQNKRKIVQHQFNQRQSAYEAKLQRLKQGKINRLLKNAINQIKQKTLSERQ